MPIMDKKFRFILKEMNKEFEKKEKDREEFLTTKERKMLEEKIMGKEKRAKKRKMRKEMSRIGNKGNFETKSEEARAPFIKELNKVVREIERAFNPLMVMQKKKVIIEKEKKIKTILQYGSHVYIKSIRKDTPESFDYTIHHEGKRVATVCLLRLFPNIYARGIAICGPTDKNITASKGKDIAYRRAKFALRERLSTCVIRRKNGLIEIVRKEFDNKYKAQYRVVLTEQEEKMIAQKDVRSMRYYSTKI